MQGDFDGLRMLLRNKKEKKERKEKVIMKKRGWEKNPKHAIFF
jgi:hypothetical protein